MPTIKMSDERILSNFADKLITDKGVSGLSNEQRGFLRRAIVSQLQDKIETEVLNSLSDKDLKALSELVGRDAPDDEVQTFLKSIKVDFAKVSMGALGKYREEYLASEDDMEMIKSEQSAYEKFIATTPVDQSSPDGNVPIFTVAANTNTAEGVN